MSERFKLNGHTELPIPSPYKEAHGLSGWCAPDFEAIKQNMTTVPENQRVKPLEYVLYEDLAEGRIPIDIAIFTNGQH